MTLEIFHDLAPRKNVAGHMGIYLLITGYAHLTEPLSWQPADRVITALQCTRFHIIIIYFIQAIYDVS